MTPELNPGQILDMLLESPDGTRRVATRILEIGPKGFAVFRPMVDGAPVPIGSELTLTFPRGNAIWTLKCPVEAVISMRVDLAYPAPENVSRVQRREHLRVAMTMPMDYEVHLGDTYSRPRQGVLKDLSGGGCLLLMSEEVQAGSLLRVHLSLEDLGRMEIIGRVVRSAPAECRLAGRWHVAVEFLALSERDRDRLVKFVFNKHREEVIRLKQQVR